MSRMGISEAFGRYGAKLHNPQWSVCAWTPDGALVICVWQHHFKRVEGRAMEVIDSFARWRGPGNNEFRRNVRQAHDEKKPLRIVIVQTVKDEDQAKVQTGEDASGIPKTYSVREDLVGEVASIDDEQYVFRIERRA